MSVLLLTARVALCAVFAAAGFAKLLNRAETRGAVVGFGVPSALASPLALLVPLSELAAAVLLLPAGTATAGAALGLGLLIVFSVAVALNMARGRAPECHCFGQLHSAPTGPKTLARNGVLGAAAVFVLVGGNGPSAVAWTTRLHGTGVVAIVGGLVGGALLSGLAIWSVALLRAYGRVLVRVDLLERALRQAGIEVDDGPLLEVVPPHIGLAPGTPAPVFAVSDVTGARVSLADLLAAQLPLMLVFASPHCGPCSVLLPQVAEWQREHADRVTVAVASDGPTDAVRSEAEELGLEHALLDEDSKLYAAFGANGTPGAVLVAVDGTIASNVASGREAIERLLDGVVDVPGLPIGASAPPLALDTLDGQRFQLSERAGVETLALFWNPDCGFCRAMREEIRAWESTLDQANMRLVVFSSGEIQATRDEGFRSVVVLDPEFTAGDLLGAGGTPSALLIGRDGRIASGVAVGADAVLELAAAREMVGMAS